MCKYEKLLWIATYQSVSLLTPFQNFFILRAAYRGKPRGLNPPPAFYVTQPGVGFVTVLRYTTDVIRQIMKEVPEISYEMIDHYCKFTNLF